VDAQFAMMPEVEARRMLGAECTSMRLVHPVGSWAGVGRLRVLCVRVAANGLELLAGYERYEPIDSR